MPDCPFKSSVHQRIARMDVIILSAKSLLIKFNLKHYSLLAGIEHEDVADCFNYVYLSSILIAYHKVDVLLYLT